MTQPDSSVHRFSGRKGVLAFSGDSPMAPTYTLEELVLLVNNEYMGKDFKLFSLSNPHMRIFYLSWISFFRCFLSPFVSPPLIPIIRDSIPLNLGQALPVVRKRRNLTKDPSLLKGCVLFMQIMMYSLTNYRTWIFVLLYCYSMGVELSVDNVIAKYLYERFDFILHTTCLIATALGMTDLLAGHFREFVLNYTTKLFGISTNTASIGSGSFIIENAFVRHIPKRSVLKQGRLAD